MINQAVWMIVGGTADAGIASPASGHQETKSPACAGLYPFDRV